MGTDTAYIPLFTPAGDAAGDVDSMDTHKKTLRDRFMFSFLSVALWGLLLSATWMASSPVATAQVNFAFSVGDGVNAYYLPNASSFVYTYDGYYYDWAGNSWLYWHGLLRSLVSIARGEFLAVAA